MDGDQYALTIRALRDAGPVTRMDASGLIVKVDVFSVDRTSLPELFRILEARANLQSQTWNMADSEDFTQTKYFDGTGYSIIFRDGPVWAIGEFLNVALQFEIGSQILQFSTSEIKIEKN